MRAPDRHVARACRRALLAALLALLTAAAAAGGNLLPAREAFRLTGEWAGGEIVVRFRIADGYYLYRDKLRFSVEPASVVLGRVNLPRGKVKHDEFFGRSEVFRNDLVVRIPVELPAGGVQGFSLLVRSQGCADAGVCYTPTEARLEFGPGRGPAAPEQPAGSRGKLLESLGADRP